MNNYSYSDEQYGLVLDNFVIGCVDVAIVYETSILLERRINDPIKDEWWIFGGRMKIGEGLKETAARSASREIYLRIDKERFFEVGVYNLLWPTRREPRSSNGCHHLLIAHGVHISKAELDEVNTSIRSGRLKAEWRDYDDILSGDYLSEIKDMVSKLRSSS